VHPQAAAAGSRSLASHISVLKTVRDHRRENCIYLFLSKQWHHRFFTHKNDLSFLVKKKYFSKQNLLEKLKGEKQKTEC